MYFLGNKYEELMEKTNFWRTFERKEAYWENIQEDSVRNHKEKKEGH